mgnify:CR=1 FL=1
MLKTQMQRRKFIQIVGGGVVLAAISAPMAASAMFNVPNSALAAWQKPNADLSLRE